MTAVDPSSQEASSLRPEGDEPARKRPWLALIVVLAVLPLGLRLWPIAHGAPRPAYVPDTHIVRNALNMAKNKDLVPPGGTYSSYPYLLSYTLLPVFAADYVRGRVMGDWAGAGEFGAKLQENPWRAHLIARIVCAILSASVAFFLFMAARASGFSAGAWVAAWLGGTGLLHVQMSTQERPWAPMTAALAATVWGAAVHASTGTTRSLLAAGIAAAIAFSILPIGGLALLMAGVSWAVAPRPESDLGLPVRTAFGKRVARGFACVGLFAVLAAVVGYPFYLRHGPPETVAAGDLVTESMWTIQFGGTQMRLGFSLETFRGLMRTFLGYDPVTLVMGALGLVLAFRRRALVPLAVFFVVWGALFLVGVNEQVRYIIPVVVLMALPAGAFAEWLLERPAARPASKIVVAALMALPLVQALRLGYVLRQRDTRAVAEELIGQLPEGAVVAVDVYGPVPPQTLRTLETTRALRERVGSELYGREAHRLMMLEAGAEQPPGYPVLRLEDVFEYSLHNGETWIREGAEEGSLDLGETAASALAAIGATHILLTDRSPEDGVPPPLIDPTPPTVGTAREGPGTGETLPPKSLRKLAPLELPDAPVWTVHPAWSVASAPEDAAPVPDAHLPTTLDFPLRDLWRVRRPGPKLELYELRR